MKAAPKTKAMTALPTAEPARPPVPTAEGSAPEKDEPSVLQQVTGSANARFSNALLNTLLNCLPRFTGESPEDRQERIGAALAAVRGFGARDEVEGMLAAQATALHLGTMECLRRAMLAGQDEAAADRLRRQGANLARAMVEMTEALDRRRGHGVRQVVRVERVVVHEGGQAIVGAVAAGKSDPPGGEG